MHLFRRVKYWYKFAKRVWLPLGAGWLAVVVGLTPWLRMDRSGALLVCSVIVAEVFNDKRHRRFVDNLLPGIAPSYLYREVEMKDGNTIHQGIEITSPPTWNKIKSTVNADDWHLYQLAVETEFREYEGSRAWDLDRTMKRLESRVDYAIVLSAAIGTVLWAFAGPS